MVQIFEIVYLNCIYNGDNDVAQCRYGSCTSVAGNYFMTEETLIFKDKIVTGNNLEIIFHRDFTYMYNEAEFPVVRYRLTNCENLDKVDFEKIDYYNDGVTIKQKENSSGQIFTTTDMHGITVTIECERIEFENKEYDKADLIDIIKDLQRQVDEYHDRQAGLEKQKEQIKSYLTKEIETTDIKLNQADWLTDQKKQFFTGHLTTLRKIMELIESREK